MTEPHGLQAIPRQGEGRVGTADIDANGHLNIVRYVELNAVAVSRMLGAAGLDADFRARHGVGLFTLEHHVRYRAELRPGDGYTTHPTVVAWSARTVHAISFLLDHNGVLANSLETVVAFVDKRSRRVHPLPAGAAAALAGIRARDRDVPWRRHLCGVMGIRKKSPN